MLRLIDSLSRAMSFIERNIRVGVGFRSSLAEVTNSSGCVQSKYYSTHFLKKFNQNCTDLEVKRNTLTRT